MRTLAIAGPIAAALLAFAAPVAAQVVFEAPGSSSGDDEDVTGEDCPDPMRATELSATPVRHGVELEFTVASRLQLPRLRKHLRSVAEYLEQESKKTAPPGEEASQIPPVDVAVENTALGARVILQAGRPEHIRMLRQLGDRLEEAWDDSACSARMSMPTSGRSEDHEDNRQIARSTPHAPRR